MPIAKEAKDTLKRFSTYIQELIALCRRQGVTSPKGLWRAARSREFRKEWKAIWVRVADADGGKLTLGTVFGIVGAVLGGVGIAAGGGAIGVPMALLLAPIGFLVGGDLDSSGWGKKVKAFFGGTSEAPVDEKEKESDDELDEITSMMEDLLARSDDADETIRATSSKVAELEKTISHLWTKAERYEAEAREGQLRTAALESKVSELERIVAESRAQFGKVTQRLQTLSWAALSIAMVAIAGMFWVLFKK
jgi:hypothetical protein